MFHGFKKTKGVISVFLVMILVPMLTASSVLVDASKMVLAHSVAESAADLALNTVLTHYDRKLNEYYGLISSAQNMDEAYAAAEKFFVDCMKSQGISDEDSSGVFNQIMGYISGDSTSISDFLGISADEEALTVKPLENSSLGNAAIFKTQVVEFMKYRAPINAVGELFDFLKNNSEELTHMDEITDMTEKKQEFYESESTLMQTLYDLYGYLKSYDNFMFTENAFRTLQSNLQHGGSYKARYREIHKAYVTSIVNTGWYNGKEYTVKALPEAKKGVLVTRQVSEIDENGSSVRKNVPDLESAIDKMCTAYGNYASARRSMNEALKLCGAYDESGCVYCKQKNNINKIQYFGIVGNFFEQNSETFTKFCNSVNAFEQAYKNFLKTYSEQDKSEYAEYKIDQVTVGNSVLEGEAELKAGTRCDISNFKSKMERAYNTQKNGGGIKKYNDIQNHLAETSKEIDSNKANKTKEEIESLNEEINNYAVQLRNVQETLKKAIDKTDAILNALNDYTKKLNSWDSAANSSSLNSSSTEGSIVQSDREEISGKRNGTETTQGDEILKELKKDDVQDLKYRLSGIQSRVDFLYKAIYNFKYGHSTLMAMNFNILHKEAEETGGCKFDSFMKADVENNIRVFDKENIANKTPGKFFSTYEDTSIAEKAVQPTDFNNPSFEEKKNKFREYLYEYFKNAENQKSKESMSKDKAKEKKDNFKDKSESGADSLDFSALISSTEEIVEQADLPSKNGSSSSGSDVAKKSSKLNEVSEFVTNLFKDFKKTASEGMVNLRDDLLFSDYVMSMFSYDTYEVEGLLDYAVEKEGYKVTSFGDWTKKMGNYKSTWTEKADDKTFKFNKTLRNNPINDSTCFSYGNEVEYILYGKTNAENKSAAYGNIYAIRFACNLMPVFQTYWNNGMVISIATSISAATYGIIPAPLTKLLICLGVTAAEAAIDLAALKTGVGVKFIKKGGKVDSELFIDPQNIGSWIGGSDVSGENSKNGKTVDSKLPCFQYSDYLRFFLILNLLGSNEAGICKRTADVVQVNMIKITKDTDYRILKSNVYFKVNARVAVRPLMLSLGINESDSNPYTTLSELAAFDYEMIRGY